MVDAFFHLLYDKKFIRRKSGKQQTVSRNIWLSFTFTKFSLNFNFHFSEDFTWVSQVRRERCLSSEPFDSQSETLSDTNSYNF